MPLTLPTIVIQNDETASIFLEAFTGERAEDGTILTPQQAYRRWLREQLIAKVSYNRIQARRSAREEADRLDLEAERTLLETM